MTPYAKQAQRIAAKARQERREFREIIRRIGRKDLTKSQKAILEVLVNLWFAHRYGEGVIRPGRERLAKRCDVHVNTVKSTLDRLRTLNVITAVEYASGGSKATRYTVDLDTIRSLWGGALPLVAEGDLVEIKRTKLSGSKSLNRPVTPDKNCPRKEDIYTSVEPVFSVASPFQRETEADIRTLLNMEVIGHA